MPLYMVTQLPWHHLKYFEATLGLADARKEVQVSQKYHCLIRVRGVQEVARSSDSPPGLHISKHFEFRYRW